MRISLIPACALCIVTFACAAETPNEEAVGANAALTKETAEVESDARRRPSPAPSPGGTCAAATSPHGQPNLTSFFNVTCQLKEHLKIATKTEQCAAGYGARVVYLSNCTFPANPNPGGGFEWAKDGMALTTYYPGMGCWSAAKHAELDALGLAQVAPGTKVDIVLGQFRTFGGKGSGPGGFAEDVHQITVAGRTACTTDHGVNSRDQVTGRPSVLWVVNSENTWLREN
jgi:hypothetical protein